MFVRKALSFLSRGVEVAASLVRPVHTRVLLREATDIRLERQRRALASTVDFVEEHMPGVRACSSKFELLAQALQRADLSGDRLICEFGVFRAATINYIASLTSKTVFGFDSFEGLPEDWRGTGIKKGHFALGKLPAVRNNVVLVKGWFHETIPPFMKQNSGMIGFIHIDCDLYSSAKVVLYLLQPRLSAGTMLVFDEYFNFPQWQQGEHRAFTEFLEKAGLTAEYIGFHGKDQQVAAILKARRLSLSQ